MFRLNLLLSLAILAASTSAQYWEQTYGTGMTNAGHALEQTADGGFVLLGRHALQQAMIPMFCSSKSTQTERKNGAKHLEAQNRRTKAPL